MKLKKWLPVILTIIVLAIANYFYSNKIFSIHFVDEEDNFVLGYYLNHGEKLYSDLFSHHQPLAYIFSAGIQRVAHPTSLYTLIKDHREAMMGWSIIWSILLVIRFGYPMVFFVMVYELTKIYFLGNQFLSESLVVYPLAYLLGNMYSQKIRDREALLIGLCTGLVFFLLAPVWPLLLLTSFVFIKKLNKHGWIQALVGFGSVTLISALFSSIGYYFYNVFYINYKYYIPSFSTDSEIVTIAKSFLTPFISFASESSPIGVVIKVLSALLIFFWVNEIRNKRYKSFLTSFFLLGLSNLRFVSPGLDYYNGFHLLAWYGGLLIGLGYFLMKLKTKWSLLIIFGVVLLVGFYDRTTLFRKDDLGTDFYVNYSRQFDLGEAVKAMKGPGDKLFVAPDEWLIYWQADIPHASKMVNYYPWMAKTPPLRSLVDNMFKTPPTFFYCDCTQELFLNGYLGEYHQMIKRGQPTELYVLRQKFDNLTKDQRNQLNFYGFEN